MRFIHASMLFATLALPSLVGCNSGEPYLSCSADTPCSGDTRLCLSNTSPTGHTIRFCSKRCTTAAATSSECPNGGACIHLNGGDPVCIPRCAVATDCPFSNAACTTLTESLGARVCSVQ